MKKKNALVSYEEKKVVPVEKKKNNKIIIAVVIIVVVLSLVIFIASLLNPSNKAKKYLESNGYTCNKQTCTKDENNNIYTFNYEKLTYYVDTDFYSVNISESLPSLTLKDDDYVCDYTKDDYKKFTLVDDTFIYNQICEKYVENVNSHIREYEKIITESKINVNR